MATGMELAMGAQSASYIQEYRSEFEFDVSTGNLDDAGLIAKYNLTAEQLADAKDFYAQGNNFELDRLLAQVAPKPVEEPAVEEANPVLEVQPEVKPEYGYEARPLGHFLFVKPAPAEHKGRLITPKAYESESDMGFVRSVGPLVEGVAIGDFVLFDKYATTGNQFDLLDEDGDVVPLLKMQDVNITAVLIRKKTKYAEAA